MKSIFSFWLKDSLAVEKLGNMMLKNHVGVDCEPIVGHDWCNSKVAQDQGKNNIFNMNTRQSGLAATGNKSFMSFMSSLPELLDQLKQDPKNAQTYMRQVMHLSHFRKFGFHELNLTSDQAEGLINTDVNLDVDDFTSMFPIMIVNFPEDIIKKYDERNEFFPSIAFVRHNPDNKYILLEFIHPVHHHDSVSYGTLTFFSKSYSNFNTIQEKLDSEETKKVMSKPIIDATKLAINSILLAQRTSSMKRLDSPDDYHHKDLCRVLRGNGKFDKRTVQASFWSFQTNLKTFNKETLSSGGETGKMVKPHWRRGHWRRIVHGIKRLERKWMHFPAVFINAQCFSGDASNTVTSHTLNQKI